MSILKPLVWHDKTDFDLNLKITARSALHEYVITEPTQGVFELKKTRLSKPDKKSEILENFQSSLSAKEWCWNHYNEKMQPYINDDSTARIENWVKAAKPEPTDKDKTTQLGCIVEEFAELMDSVGLDGTARELVEIADMLKEFTPKYATKFISRINRLEALDATSDITVTVQGFNRLMGFDGLGALNEVIRSNDSKFENGKPIFNEQGKIMKGKDYSEPDLTPFISTTQNLHKGD